MDYYGTTSYSASYDASGNMVCRAPTSSVTCAGSSPTGQHLSYDNEGRLTAWQNAPSSPTSTAQYLYDGEGNRVEQQATSGGTTTTTVYVGDLESVATTGGTTTTTTYYYAGRQCVALAVNGTLSYLASDLLGSATVALDSSGNATASQLYAPYGGIRYRNGTMPTDYGFTGQRADTATGLDYYGARFYDPTLGQFTSADDVLDGLNRYAYVGGNPINHIDPSGHRDEEMPDGYGDGGEAPGDGTGDGVEGGGDGTGPAVNTTTTIPQDDVSPDYIEVVNADGSITWEPTNVTEQDLEDAKRADENTRHPETTSDDQLITVDGAPEFNQSNAPRANETPPENPDNPNTPNTPNQPETPNTPNTPNSAPTANPDDAFNDLAQQRANQGIPPAGSEGDASTFARLDVNGKSYYGQNGRSQPITLRVNAISKYHAETNAFQRAYDDGIQGGDGILYVDRPMCPACGQNGAVRSLGQQLGLSSLIVFDPFDVFFLI